MKKLDLKSAVLSTIIIYVLGVSAFVGSHFVPIMSDAARQANWVLMVAIIPAALFGAQLYYKKGHDTNGFLLGACFFLLTIILDALITVPLFVIPAGGDYISFFSDPGFWLIGLEYVVVVAAYWWIRRGLKIRHVRGI